MDKQRLVEQLNILKSNLTNFIYPDYPDFKIYSKEYYRNIFLNFFSDTQKKFSFMYADFNKLDQINNSFGNIAGDKALEIGHKLIHETFPEDSYISRVGGDETIGIFQDLDKTEALAYTDLLTEKLKKFSKSFNTISITLDSSTTSNNNNNLCYINVCLNDIQIIKDTYGEEAYKRTLDYIKGTLNNYFSNNLGINKIDSPNFTIIIPKNINEEELLTIQNQLNRGLQHFLSPLSISITTSISDSTIADIRTLEYITEQDVSSQKHLRNLDEINKNEKDPWKTLASLINTSIENHLSDIRPSDQFIYEIDDYKKEMFYMIDTFINRLEYDISMANINTNNVSDDLNTLDHPEENENNKPSETHSIFADSKLVSFVHSFLTNKLELDQLNEESLPKMFDFMNTLLNNLTLNKDSKLLNKSYLKQHLAEQICKNKANFQAVFLSMSGIKPNNSAFGHHATDEKMLKTTNILKGLFYKNRTFNNEAFTFSNEDSYFIDYGGGNFLILLSEKQKMTQKELDDKLATINNLYDPQNPNSSLQVAGFIQEYIRNDDISTFIKSIRILKEQCNCKKDPLKKEAFTSIAQKISFEKSIEKPIKYYLNNIPNSNDINNKKKFIHMIFESLLNKEANYNKKSRVKNTEISLE